MENRESTIIVLYGKLPLFLWVSSMAKSLLKLLNPSSVRVLYCLYSTSLISFKHPAATPPIIPSTLKSKSNTSAGLGKDASATDFPSPERPINKPKKFFDSGGLFSSDSRLGIYFFLVGFTNIFFEHRFTSSEFFIIVFCFSQS